MRIILSTSTLTATPWINGKQQQQCQMSEAAWCGQKMTGWGSQLEVLVTLISWNISVILGVRM